MPLQHSTSRFSIRTSKSNQIYLLSGLPSPQRLRRSKTTNIFNHDFQVHSGCSAPKPKLFAITTSKFTAAAPLQNQNYFQSDFQVDSGCAAPKLTLFSNNSSKSKQHYFQSGLASPPTLFSIRTSKCTAAVPLQNQQYFQSGLPSRQRLCRSKANPIFNQFFQVDSGCAAPEATLFSIRTCKSTAATPLQKQHYFQSGLASPQRLRRSKTNTIFNQDLQVHSGYAAPKPPLFSIRTSKSTAAICRSKVPQT